MTIVIVGTEQVSTMIRVVDDVSTRGLRSAEAAGFSAHEGSTVRPSRVWRATRAADRRGTAVSWWCARLPWLWDVSDVDTAPPVCLWGPVATMSGHVSRVSRA